MQNLINGMCYMFAGFGLITQPGIRRFVIIPLLVNILLFCLLFVALHHYIAVLNAWVLQFLPGWLQWLGAIIWVLFFLAFSFVFIYAFTAVGAIFAAPFNGVLSERVELLLTGQALPDQSMLSVIKDVPRVVGRQLAIIGFYLPRALLILILFLIPVIHTAAVFLWFAFSAWYLTLQFLDIPTDNHKVPISDVRLWMKKHRWTSWGFALALMLVLSVPLLNFVAIPAAAAGATKFWIEEGGLAA